MRYADFGVRGFPRRRRRAAPRGSPDSRNTGIKRALRVSVDWEENSQQCESDLFPQQVEDRDMRLQTGADRPRTLGSTVSSSASHLAEHTSTNSDSKFRIKAALAGLHDAIQKDTNNSCSTSDLNHAYDTAVVQLEMKFYFWSLIVFVYRARSCP